jgi:hypothetical protein
MSSPAATSTLAYVTVAANQTAATLSSKRGTYLKRLIVQPATATPGVVTLLDGTGSGGATVYSFPGGASSVADLKPFEVNIEAYCKNTGATASGWKLTTGANVSVVAVVQPH